MTTSPTFAKIIGKNHGSYPYRVGLNTLAHNDETFDPREDCGPGGLYFCELKNICSWLGYGDTLCIVKPVGQIVSIDDNEKFKTDKLEIVSMDPLHELSTWETIIENYPGEINLDKAVDWAIKNDYTLISDYLLTHGADGEVALDAAAIYGRYDTVRSLVECGDMSDEALSTALESAAFGGSVRIVEFLMGRGVTSNGEAFVQAASRGHIAIMKLLPHDDDDLGNALYDAAVGGHIAAMEYLLELGADLNAVAYNDEAFGTLTLYNAAENGHTEAVKFLFEKVGVAPPSCKDLVRKAVESGELDLVKYLFMRYQLPVEEEHMEIAVVNGDFDIVKYFIEEFGAPIGNSVQYAMQYPKILGYLLEHGADISVALCGAVSDDDLDAVQFIVERAAPDSAAIEKAMKLAAKYGCANIVSFLRSV